MTAAIDRLTKPLKVLKKIRETSDACSIVLDIPREHANEFVYRPGQFVTLFLKVNGEDLRRSYSLCTSPFHDTDFRITVKKVPGGRGSTFLVDQLHEGDILHVTPPSGHFFTPPKELKGQHYVLFAAGSGITPVFSILKSMLKVQDQNQVTLVYCNRDEASIIYRAELNHWLSQFPGRLQVHHVLSSLGGRLDIEKLSKLWTEIQTQSKLNKEFYMCGPVPFMTLISDYCEKNGVAKDRIHIESFGEMPLMKKIEAGVGASTSGADPSVAGDGSSAAGFAGAGSTGKSADSGSSAGAGTSDAEENIPGRVYIGAAAAPGDGAGTLFANCNGEALEVAANGKTSVLETLLAAGHNPPYSCMDGACMACMAKLVEGRVYQNDPGILTDENIERCEILTCQARPLSKIVKVDYDNL